MRTKSLDILERAQLPPAQVRAILQVMEAEFGTEELATKADLAAMRAELKAELATGLTSIRSEIAAMKDEFLARFATKAEMIELKAAMLEMKPDLMRWMFVFWVGQIAAVFAIIRYLK